MPPPTIPPDTSSRLDAEIQRIIDQLEQSGDRFQDVIEALRDLQGSF
jgi:hypothetical protein